MSKATKPSDQLAAPLTRRTVIAGAATAIAAGGIAIIGTGPAAAAKKSPQAKVKYQDTPKGERKCSNCKFFEAETKTCEVVEGTIAPEGWCARYAKA
ncbi:MAG: high-potential iron-sulfur protein [Methyloligellaceae bacterium]